MHYSEVGGGTCLGGGGGGHSPLRHRNLRVLSSTAIKCVA